MKQSRRDFLRTSLGASILFSLGPPVPAVFARLAGATAPDKDGSVFVAIQLAGGNDGLNTVAPYADDDYARSRSTLRLTANEVHKIDDLLGFHPRMAGFMRLYEEGLLSVVQGVGYPNSDREHEGAMRNWQTARPGDVGCQTGWLGRAADLANGPDESHAPAAFVGQIPTPFVLNAERTVVPAVSSLDDYVPGVASGSQADAARRRALLDAAELPRGGDDGQLLGFAQRTALNAYAGADRVEAVAAARRAGRAGQYPPFQLAQNLSTVADLIRADLGIRVYVAELGGAGFGGFDNHANQRDNHAALLCELSESVAAFAHDLKGDGLLDRVLLMTFSEFGRTVAENGRRGTGHGAAAPVFLVGGRLKGGLVGPHPSLSDLENDGALRFHTDYRRVYATALDRWLGLDSEAALGARFEPLDVLRS